MWLLDYAHSTLEIGHEHSIARSLSSYEKNVIHIVQMISLLTPSSIFSQSSACLRTYKFPPPPFTSLCLLLPSSPPAAHDRFQLFFSSALLLVNALCQVSSACLWMEVRTFKLKYPQDKQIFFLLILIASSRLSQCAFILIKSLPLKKKKSPPFLSMMR